MRVSCCERAASRFAPSPGYAAYLDHAARLAATLPYAMIVVRTTLGDSGWQAGSGL